MCVFLVLKKAPANKSIVESSVEDARSYTKHAGTLMMSLHAKGPGKRGHIVSDTLFPTRMFPRLSARAAFAANTILCPGHKKCF